jgi:hypothetical protein
VRAGRGGAVHLGFAPILAFLRATMGSTSVWVDWRATSTVLLSLALLAGVIQLWRCLLVSKRIRARGRFVGVLVVWLIVFGHVLRRMGSVLGR